MQKYETDAAQDPKELAKFIDLLKHENVRSYLEIGSRYGGSLWKIAREVLPVGSRVVSVDLPSGFGGRKDGQVALQSCIDELNRLGYDAHVFFGDSTDPAVIAQVRAMGEFDAVFIDGHHAMAYVVSDWKNYGSLGRIVGFHDIAWWRPPGFTGAVLEVAEYWNEIKGGFRHVEFKENKKDNGIGVLWRS